MNSLVNGIPGSLVSCTDRGLQYGDGLFETIACKTGKLLLWQAHMDRLQESCERLKIPVVDAEIWLDDIRKLAMPDKNNVIKLIITRGTSGRGYASPAQSVPTRIVAAYPWPNYLPEHENKGVRVRVCQTQASMNPSLAGLKHLNRLDNVLARNEWVDEDIYEGLMLDNMGHVIEGTMSNVFAVKNDIMYTPAIKDCGVKGVVRSAVIQLAAQNHIRLIETELKVDSLVKMDELFITNSIIGVLPVKQLEEHSFIVGPTTQFMSEKLNMEGNCYAL